MIYLLYIFIGILPSLIWLAFYLNKDRHPEPKRMVLKVFLWGALMGPAAIILQFFFVWLFSPTFDLRALFENLKTNQSLIFLNILIVAPLTEEYLKYAVVKWNVLKDPAFDEPIDAMIYLIVSALGFAALENILNIFQNPDVTFQIALSRATARFLSATFLHTLSSGILGYFLARSLCNIKKRRAIMATGFFLAVFFHSLYNYLAKVLEFHSFLVFVLALFLILLMALVLNQFKKLKKQLSVCLPSGDTPQKHKIK